MKSSILKLFVFAVSLLLLAACSGQALGNSPTVNPTPGAPSPTAVATAVATLPAATPTEVSASPTPTATPSYQGGAGQPSTVTPPPVVPTSAPTTAATPQTITLASNGQTIVLHPGDRFLLDLGEGFTWAVTVDNPAIVSRVPNITVIRGAQGVYQANRVGSAGLSAAGRPNCTPSPQQVCSMLEVGFNLHIIVQ